MDARSFRNANRLVGNPPDTAALEMTVSGPTLRFLSAARVARAGALMRLALDGQPVDGPVIEVPAGSVLSVAAIEGPGQRAYLAVAGGFDAPVVLGSRACFALGQFGGPATGVLKTGDVLRFGTAAAEPDAPEPVDLTHDWELSVVYGPHGAPDFFRDSDIDTLFRASYEVHFNSARTGVRLIGPAPDWARADGGEAGLHPSNLHDNPYAVGAVDFTGDIADPAGSGRPEPRGFVCPAVVARDELWKLGQLRPGDRVRFRPVERPDPVAGPAVIGAGSPVVGRRDSAVPVVFRRQGDESLLVEYGDMTLDIGLRLRVHLLAQAVAAAGLPVIDLTPGIRSLQLHYDPDRITRADLVRELDRIDQTLPPAETVTVPSRIVHLPLSWNDPQADLAMRKYQELVRPDAPWCPSNIEFIRRINGLADEAAVHRVVFDARYLVLGLGDVYLGAPVATPVDPPPPLVTTKYNPARTWTPENAVGIGGAYMCIYGMEGPGGYQLVGRTTQVWNTWNRIGPFAEAPGFCASSTRSVFSRSAPKNSPRPARPFRMVAIRCGSRRPSSTGRRNSAGWRPRPKASPPSRRRSRRLSTPSDSAGRRPGSIASWPRMVPAAEPGEIPDGCVGVESPVPGNVWKFLVDPGAMVAAGDCIAIVESMKMEIAVNAPRAGRLRDVRAVPGRTVRAGDVLAVMDVSGA